MGWLEIRGPTSRNAGTRRLQTLPVRAEPCLPRAGQDDRARRRRRVALRHRAGQWREVASRMPTPRRGPWRNSALVKTSWHGGDPNWGRIIDALGYSPATVDRGEGGHRLQRARQPQDSLEPQAGQPTKATFKELCAAVAPKEFDLHINLNLGPRGALHVRRRPDRGICGLQQRRRERSRLAGRMKVQSP